MFGNELLPVLCKWSRNSRLVLFFRCDITLLRKAACTSLYGHGREPEARACASTPHTGVSTYCLDNILLCDLGEKFAWKIRIIDLHQKIFFRQCIPKVSIENTYLYSKHVHVEIPSDSYLSSFSFLFFGQSTDLYETKS